MIPVFVTTNQPVLYIPIRVKQTNRLKIVSDTIYVNFINIIVKSLLIL